MDTEEEAVCGCLVFLNPNKPHSENSSKYLLRYGDVVRIGSKPGDDIRLRHLTDLKTDAVLISGEETGFIQATNPEYAETILNNSRLSAPKYLLPGDKLHIKGKIFMYDASFSAEDIAMLKAKNTGGLVRQVPKKRHSVMMYSIANSFKQEENEEFPIPEPTVFVREGFEFEAEFLPTPVTPSKTNYVATTPRMRKLSIRSEMPKTANNVLAKKKKSLRRYSMDVASRSLGSPFLRLRKSHATSPKQVLKAMTDEDLIAWTTPPMSSASLVAQKSVGLLSGRRSSVAGNVTRRSIGNLPVNKTFEDHTTGRKSSFVGRLSVNQNSMVEKSSLPNLTTARKSTNIRTWSNDSSDDEDVVFVNSHRMSDYVHQGSFRGSFADGMGRKSQSSAVERQSIMQNISNNTIGDVEEFDEDSVLSEAEENFFPVRRFVRYPKSALSKTQNDLLPSNETGEYMEESQDSDLFSQSPTKGRKSEFTTNVVRSVMVTPVVGRQSTSRRSTRSEVVPSNITAEEDLEAENYQAQSPPKRSVGRNSSTSSITRHSGKTSEFINANMLGVIPLVVGRQSSLSRRSARSEIQPSNEIEEYVEDFNQEDSFVQSPMKGRKSVVITNSRKSDMVSPVVGRQSTSRRSTRSEIMPSNTTAEEDLVAENHEIESPPRKSVGRSSTTSTVTRRSDRTSEFIEANMSGVLSPVVGRQSSLSRRSARSEIQPSNEIEEYVEDFNQEESFVQSPTKGSMSTPYTNKRFEITKSPIVGTQSTSRKSTKTEIAPNNTMAEEDFEAANYEAQPLPRKSTGRISASSTITRRSARSEVMPSNETGEYLDESQDFDLEHSPAQSPTKGRNSELSTNSRKSDMVSPVVGRQSTSRRSTRSEFMPSNTTAEEDLVAENHETPSPPRKSVGRSSTTSTVTRRSDKTSEFIEANMSGVLSPVVGRQSSLSRRSARSEMQPSNEIEEYVEEFSQEDSFVQSPMKGRMSTPYTNRRSKMTECPIVGRQSTSRKSSKSEIVPNNTTADEDLETESYEAQPSLSKSISRISATSTNSRRSARSEILPSNDTEEYVEELQDFDEKNSFGQSPTKARKSAVSSVSYSEESFDRSHRRSTRNQLPFSHEENVSTEKRPTLYQNVLSKTLNDNFKSPKPSVGRKSSTIERSGRNSEIADDDMADAASPVVDRRSMMSRRSTRSVFEQSNRSGNREESFYDSVFEEVCPSNKTEEYVEDFNQEDSLGQSPTTGRMSTPYTNRSGKSEVMPSNETGEYVDESQVFDQEHSSAQSPAKGRKSELITNSRKSDIVSPVVGRQSTSRRSTRSEIMPSNTTAEEDLVAENYETQSPPRKSVGRSSTTSTVTRRSNRPSEFIEANMSGVISPVVGRQSSLSRRSARSEIQASNEIEEYVEDFNQEDSFAQSPTKGRMSTPSTNSRRSELAKSPMVGKQSISRRSTKSEIVPNNTTAEEEETESYESQLSPRKSISTIFATSTKYRRSARGEILPSDDTIEYVEELQDFDQTDSFGQSPTKVRKSAVSSVSYSEESFDRSYRRSTKNQLPFSLEEKASTERRPTLYKNVLSKTLNDNFKSRRPSVGRKSSTIERSGRNSEIADDDMADAASPVVDRRSTMSRKSTRSVNEESKRSGNQDESLDDSVFEEEVCLSNVASPVVNRRSGRSVIEQSNESRNDVEPTDESVVEEVSDRRPSRSQNALSKTLTIFDGISPKNISIGRKSAPSNITRRSDKIMDILDLNLSVASPVVDRTSTMSRRSAKNVLEQSNDSSSQVEPADESVLNVSDRRPIRSQNALSKTLTNIDGQSPRNISIGRKSAPPKIARRSDKILEILDLDLSSVAPSVVDRKSTYSRRATRSLANPSDSTLEDDERSSDREESPTKSAGSLASTKTKHSVLEIQESPDAASIMGSRGSPVPSSVGSQSTNGSTRRSTRYQLVEEQASSSTGNSTRKSMRNQNETCNADQEEYIPESPILSSVKFQRSSRSSSQSPLKVRQLQESILMGSPDLSANKPARNGRSSLKLPQYDDVTMEEEDVEDANDSDQENSEDEINISGIQRLQKSPYNDLTDVTGVKHLFTGPPKTPKLDGIKAIFNHERSPENDLTDIRGVKKLFTAKSPLNDLSNIAPGCVKEVFRADPYNSYSPVKNLKDVFRRSPRNELTILGGVKRVFRANAPKDDLTNVYGVKAIFKHTGPRQVPDTPNLQEVKMFKTPKTLRKIGAASFAEKLEKEPTAPPKGTVPSNDSFDSLIGKPACRTYERRDIQGSPRGSRKTMNDSLSETFDSIKKKRKLAKTPRPIVKEGVLDASGSREESEEARQLLPRLSLDLFNAKRPEENLDLEETPGRIIENTSTPLPISSSRTQSKLNLMASAEPKDESVAKNEKTTRSTRRNLTSTDTPQEDIPAPRTRRKLASTDTPEKPTRSQKAKKLEEVKETVKHESSKPSRSRRNQAQEILVGEDMNLKKPDSPEKTKRNAKDNITSNDEDNKGPTEVSVDDVLPKRSSKRKIAEDHVDDSPLPATKTKRARGNAKNMNKVENDVTNDESAEEASVAEKPNKGKRNGKKIDKLEQEEPKGESVKMSPVVAKRPARGRPKKNLDKNVQETLVSKDKPVQKEDPKDEYEQKSPAVTAKPTRGRKNTKNNLDKDAEETSVSKDKPAQEEEHILLPKDESEVNSPVAAKSTRSRKNNKKNLDRDAQETPVSKDKPVQEEHILLPKEELELKSPVVAAKSTRGRKNTKKNMDKDAQETPVSKDPVQEEEHILLPKEELELKSPVVVAKPTRGRRNAKKNLDTDKDEATQEASTAKDESVHETPVIEKKTARGRRNAKKVEEKAAPKHDLDLSDDEEQDPVAKSEPIPKSTRNRRNAKRVDNLEKEDNTDDLATETSAAADKPKPRSRRNAKGKFTTEDDKNGEKDKAEGENLSEVEVPEESKTTKRRARNTKKNEIKHIENEKQSKPQRAKRNAKEINYQTSDTDEEDVEEKAGPQRTSRHVKFNDSIEEYEDEPKLNEEHEKPTRGKRAASKKTKPAPIKKTSKRNQTEEVVEETTRKSKRLRK